MPDWQGVQGNTKKLICKLKSIIKWNLIKFVVFCCDEAEGKVEKIK